MILLAIGLSMDSLVIALTSGAVIGNHHTSSVLKIAGILGIMQMILTIAGWYIGSTFAHFIDKYDHWLAFSILVFLGVKVIVEALRGGDKESTPFNPLNTKIMLALAVVTSIDAIAVGLSLSLVNHPITIPAIIIGLTTFFVSAFGVIFGCRVGKRYNLKINIIGGIILILIGCSILAEHTILS